VELLVFFWVIVFAAWILLSFAVAKQAEIKGRSYAQFLFISLFISPVLGFVIVASLSPIVQPVAEPKLIPVRGDANRATLDGQKMVKCPFCAEFIKAEARVCRYCNKDVSEQTARFAKEDELELARRAQINASIISYEAQERAALAESIRRANANRAAALEAKRAFRRSWKFRTAVGATLALLLSGIFVLADKAQKDSAKAEAEWNKTKVIWQNVLEECGLPASRLNGKSIYFKSDFLFPYNYADGISQPMHEWPLTADYCVFYSLSGLRNTQLDGISPVVDVDEVEISLTWKPGWTQDKVNELRAKGSLVMDTMARATVQCLGSNEAAVLSSKSYRVELKAKKSAISRQNPVETWLPNKAKCLLLKFATKEELTKTLQAQMIWEPQFIKHLDDKDYGDKWGKDNPEPYIPVKISQSSFQLLVEPTYGDISADGAEMTDTNTVAISLQKID